MKTNRWVDAYVLPAKVEPIFSSLERRATPVRLSGKDIASNMEVIRSHMLDVFLCSEQVASVIKEILSIGEAHARIHCASPLQLVGGAYSNSPWGSAIQPAVMLTGLAGTGKTECLNAIMRLMMSRNGVVDLPVHKDRNHVPACLMSLREGHTLNALLRPRLDSAFSETFEEFQGKGIRVDALLRLTRNLTRREGTCLTMVDELQFGTFGSQSNALVTGLLLSLHSLGPRLVYACNFSLLHRLQKRRQEDRQRLLSHPITLNPDGPESKCFQNVLREYFSVLPEDFDLDPVQSAEAIHRYTFGIKRAAVSLLCLAWSVAKSNRGLKAKVVLDDMKVAYLSEQYRSYQEDTEALLRHSMGDQKVRDDLKNPIRIETPNPSNIAVAQKAVDELRRQTATAHVYDLMTPAEKAAEQSLRSGGGNPKTNKGKVIPLNGPSKTKTSMLEALDQFE